MKTIDTVGIETMPRCGNHWLRWMLAEVLVSTGYSSGPVTWDSLAKIVPLITKHPTIKKCEPYRFIVTFRSLPAFFRKRVLLTRNWNDMRRSQERAGLRIRDYIAAGRYHRLRHSGAFGMTISYEQMQEDAISVLSRLLRFSGLQVADCDLENAFKTANKSHMMASEQAGARRYRFQCVTPDCPSI